MGVGMAKSGFGQSGHGDSKIGCMSRMISWDKTDFLYAFTNLAKRKVASVIFGWAWTNMGVVF